MGSHGDRPCGRINRSWGPMGANLVVVEVGHAFGNVERGRQEGTLQHGKVGREENHVLKRVGTHVERQRHMVRNLQHGECSNNTWRDGPGEWVTCHVAKGAKPGSVITSSKEASISSINMDAPVRQPLASTAMPVIRQGTMGSPSPCVRIHLKCIPIDFADS